LEEPHGADCRDYGAKCFEAWKEIYKEGIDNGHEIQRREFGQRPHQGSWVGIK